MQIVTTHKNTDFDGLASVIAATLIYPGSVAVLPKTLNPNVRAFVSLHKDLFQALTPAEVDLDAVSCLVVVDSASWSRLEGVGRLQNRGGLEIILWDHHPTGGDIAATLAFVAPMGATVTLMVQRLKELEAAISPIQATLFLMGIYEDTGSLTFPSTRPEDLFAAGHLMQCQADLNVLGSFLRPAYAPKQKDVLFEMIKTAERLEVNGHTLSISRLKSTVTWKAWPSWCACFATSSTRTPSSAFSAGRTRIPAVAWSSVAAEWTPSMWDELCIAWAEADIRAPARRC